MTKQELTTLVGKEVIVTYKDGEVERGILQYADDFSSKHNWKKPGYFYIRNSNTSFKVSHIKRCKEADTSL